MFIFFLAVLGAFALYVMTPDERKRLLGRVVPAVHNGKDAALQAYAQAGPYHDALRARTRWAVLTPALVLLNVATFVGMVFGDGPLSDPGTLVAWGANSGLRTTNGEWWRLVTSMFVHSGVLHLVADLAGLVLLGLVLERLVGYGAFAAVYFGSGIFASIAALAADPMAVNVGGSGAILGLYGLLLATAVWGVLDRPAVPIPLTAAKALIPGAAIFFLYNLGTGALSGAPALHGLVMGVVCGLVIAKGAGSRKPPAVRSAAAMAAAVAIAVTSAVPLRGFMDVKPEIARVVAFETRTADAYGKAVEQFKLGGITADVLAQTIDRTILPELQSIRKRLQALDRVPAVDRSRVESAAEYLRLRAESWQMRAEGLRKGNMLTLRKADRTEGASLDVLEGVERSNEK